MGPGERHAPFAELQAQDTIDEILNLEKCGRAMDLEIRRREEVPTQMAVLHVDVEIALLHQIFTINLEIAIFVGTQSVLGWQLRLQSLSQFLL
jgi:hypothetical protein